MTTQATTKRTSKLPKDKFYRRYAAAYVLGIPAANVPEYTWKDLFPRIYEVEDEGVTLENFRNVKAQVKGLTGANVISMVTAAQAGTDADVSAWEEVEHENMPNPPAKTPEPKKAPAPRKARAKSNLGARVKRTATNDLDAINKLYGSQS
jgi:hypothetical protein